MIGRHSTLVKYIVQKRNKRFGKKMFKVKFVPKKGIRSSQEALSATIDGCGTINISYTSLAQNL